MNLSTLMLQIGVLASVFYNSPDRSPTPAAAIQAMAPHGASAIQHDSSSMTLTDLNRPDIALCGLLLLGGRQLRRRNRFKDVTS